MYRILNADTNRYFNQNTYETKFEALNILNKLKSEKSIYKNLNLIVVNMDKKHD